MARLNSAHEVRAVAGVLLLSEVRARCRLGGVIVVVVVVECYCFLKIIIDDHPKTANFFLSSPPRE